ncbi:MAG: hypothetical protein AB8G96_00680 [Phycisphaerales bacterium]
MGAIAINTFSAHTHAADLEIRYEALPGPYTAGETVTLGIWMTDLPAAAAGFQAFLEYNDVALTFLSGGYTPLPFAQPVIATITDSGGMIDLASGIDVFNGHPPTIDDARLATLTFLVNVDICEPQVSFRPNDPPSRISNPIGQPITPLGFEVLPIACAADLDFDGMVGFQDLLVILAAWDGPCPGDLDGSGIVGFPDLVSLLAAWGPCPPID